MRDVHFGGRFRGNVVHHADSPAAHPRDLGVRRRRRRHARPTAIAAPVPEEHGNLYAGALAVMRIIPPEAMSWCTDKP